jgi:uncharacterized protein (DUF983 family)
MSLKTLAGLLRQRCPRCLEGRIYKKGMEMHQHCPVCGVQFEREPGYFIGALYVSYALATVFLGLVTLALYLAFPDLDLGWTILIAGGIFLPFVPLATRYSRVVWMYFDRWVWPSEQQ